MPVIDLRYFKNKHIFFLFEQNQIEGISRFWRNPIFFIDESWINCSPQQVVFLYSKNQSIFRTANFFYFLTDIILKRSVIKIIHVTGVCTNELFKIRQEDIPI